MGMAAVMAAVMVMAAAVMMTMKAEAMGWVS